MFKISTLIVEDNRRSRRIINEAIRIYNDSPMGKDFFIDIRSEHESYAEAATALSNQDIQLVFLDINLKGVKNGLQIFKDFSRVSYIIISLDDKIWQEILSESKHRPHDFVLKASEGNFNIELITKAIQKFIKEKKDDFFEKTLIFGDNKILIEKTVFISKHKIQVIIRDNKFHLQLMNVRNTGSNDDHFFCYDRITTTTDIVTTQILEFINIPTSKPVLSLDKIVQENNLDPNILIRISKSLIINCNFVEDFDTKKNLLTVRVRSFNNKLHGEHQVVYAYIEGTESYLIEKTKTQILDNIQSRFHRF